MFDPIRLDRMVKEVGWLIFLTFNAAGEVTGVSVLAAKPDSPFG